ncbi:FAD-binding oxidoreductase [Crossiella cryophila]|uniref:FAD/FMN-containing dehydrogenase n=1 Tax=Crossiella cryophila TaxID=43355 RepID=A0A7W7FWP2_9PSEU|nr:FAD-binding protein [Crossiella cryophila]MBB4678129.1 FAD/FMN-containing dehydrogenase [Crossiella cryophila]
MNGLSRRTLLSRAAVLGGTALVVPPFAATIAGADEGPARPANALTVPRGDHRHAALSRGQNMRWVSNPDVVRLPVTTTEVVNAVGEAVRTGKRLSVRSGGHCYEGFVDHPEVQVIIDMSCMDAVRFDTARGAFEVEAGALLGDVYGTLLRRWGVTLPGGSCHTVGVGGHVTGGGYGQLGRQHGLIVDYVQAVEVVVVDQAGVAKAVIATREANDPNRELWWAHTGGGGGSFGVVTRFWFRDPGATGSDPTKLLPAPPAEVWIHRVEWPWDNLTEPRFTRLLRNFGQWHERNSAVNSPYAKLFSRLELSTKATAPNHLIVQMDATAPDSERLLDAFVAAIGEGVGVTPQVTDKRKLPWLQSTGWQGLWVHTPTDRYKYKSSYHRKGFTDPQIAALYKALTATTYTHLGFAVSIASYGGKINTVPAEATAEPHRDSVLKLLWGTAWAEAADDKRNLQWHQEFYQQVYADTGGVPVLNEVTDGCFINYADIDISDPAWNRSTVPWTELYFKGSYRRLQLAKAKWDPRNVFRHAQSIRLPGTR